jgi:AbrB family looped-hinge helix DNA binding protein
VSYNLTSKNKEAFMQKLSTTKLSSKGQVVIPEEVRKRLGLEVGAQFVVVGEGDVVILKVIAPPSRAEFRDLVSRARRQARKAGMRKTDITAAVKKTRGGR